MSYSVEVGDTSIGTVDYNHMYTYIETSNPANADGYIAYVEIDVRIRKDHGLNVASFYQSGGNWYTRDYVTITVYPGELGVQSYTPDGGNWDGGPLEIKEGDYLGFYHTNRLGWKTNCVSAVGEGYKKEGDHIPCTNESFNVADYSFYLYGAGYKDGYRININDSWKVVSDIQINVGGSWKSVLWSEINISDVWKDIYY